MDTRAQLVTLLTNKILSGGRRTTAQYVRDLISETFDSLPNIADDANQANGYLAIDAHLKVNTSFISKVIPTGQFLRDDGTWQNANISATNGIQPIGSSFGLGGALIQDTNITGAYQFSLNVANFKSLGNTVDFTTDNGAGITPYIYLDNASNTWQIGNSLCNLQGVNDDFLLQSNTATILAPTQLTLNSLAYNFIQLTPSSVPYLDASKNLVSSAVTPTELGYVSGATSNLQAQINALLSGLSWKQAVRAATVGSLPAYTYSANVITANATGLITTQDGVTLANGDYLLVKNETAGNAPYNGIYVVTSIGGVGSKFKLTRRSDADTGANILQATVAIEEGTTLQDQQWVCNTDAPITIGVTNLSFILVGGTTYVGTTNRITVTGNAIDISASYVGQASITTLGTITAGAWTGTKIDSTYGGTGVNNGGSTITIAGNIIHAGAYTQTFTATANTTVTLPVTGTLSTLAGAETFTNKVSYNGLVITANTGVITTGTWNGTAIANANLANSAITINGTSTSLGGSINVGTILGSIAATAGLIPYCTGVANTVTSNAALAFDSTLGINIGNRTSTGQRFLQVGQDTAWMSMGSLVGATTFAAIYFNQATPGSTNYGFLGNSTTTQFNATTTIGFNLNDVTKLTLDSNGFTFTNGQNIIFGFGTGTKIGGSGSKLALYNATPIVQPTTAIAAATFVSGAGTALTDTDTFDGYTLKQIVKALRNIGALA